MNTSDKVAILADSAKYDASCSTSGSSRQNSPGGIGNAKACGICHSWTPDGRCVALLKVLLSNACAWDCAYCVNRRSNDIPRAGFEPEELVRLIMDFYKRNYLEGALLSSGVLGCPEATMERLIAVARTLRVRERFNGYLHLKAIPGASDELVMEAARWADRVSVNIELPSAASLASIAPDKSPAAIFGPMRTLARASGFEPRRLLQPPALPQAAAHFDPQQPPQASDASMVQQPQDNSSFKTTSRQTVSGLPGTNKTGSDRTAANRLMLTRSNPRQDDTKLPSRPDSPWPAMDLALPAVAEPRPLYDSTGSGSTTANPSSSPSAASGRSGSRSSLPSVMEARKNRTRNPEAAILPAGQTTQMVIGASPESDLDILTLAENLYLAYDVRRVYYSAFIPVSGDTRVPALPRPPLLREHRLYQADWLFRFYGFSADEIIDPGRPNLDDRLDPKCAWALRNLHRFPIDLDKADYLEILRVPGIGPKSASRILRARRQNRLKPQMLASLGVVMKRARWFVSCSGLMADALPGDPRAAFALNEGALRRLLSDGASRQLNPLQLELGLDRGLDQELDPGRITG
jgi:putative DNA modification/repair radical SAM protein